MLVRKHVNDKQHWDSFMASLRDIIFAHKNGSHKTLYKDCKFSLTISLDGYIVRFQEMNTYIIKWPY
jgi:hypothetical protein